MYVEDFNEVIWIAPQKKVPKIPEIMTITMGENLAPKRENIGPGQAPDMAQPDPKMVPPKRQRFQPFSLMGKVIGILSRKDSAFNLLIIKVKMALKKRRAVPMTPHM